MIENNIGWIIWSIPIVIYIVFLAFKVSPETIEKYLNNIGLIFAITVILLFVGITLYYS